MSDPFERPLEDVERHLLIDLATRSLAEQAGCSTDEAAAVLERTAAQGQLELLGDSEVVELLVCGSSLVKAQRDWLAFHAFHPGYDPMRDEQRDE